MKRQRRLPSQDPELQEMLADEPQLLAIADAVFATQRGRWRRQRARRHARRVAVPAAVLAALVLLAAGGIALLSREPAKASILQRALAAVPGEGPVTHVIARASDESTTIVDLRTGKTRPERIETELWTDELRGTRRTIVRRDGVVVTDVVERKKPSTRAPGAGRPDGRSAVGSLISTFAFDYREALTAERATAVDQRRTRRGDYIVVVRPRVGFPQRVELDRRTLLPMSVQALRSDGRPWGARWSIVRLEALPRDDVPPGAPSAGRITASFTVSLLRGRDALSVRAVWPGRHIRGLTLRQVSVQTLTRVYVKGRRHVTRSRGLELLYRARSGGSSVADERFLRIQEARQPEPAYGYFVGRLKLQPVPAQNRLRLERLEGASAPLWRGHVRKGGLYVNIVCFARATVVAAARVLRPMP